MQDKAAISKAVVLGSRRGLSCTERHLSRPTHLSPGYSMNDNVILQRTDWSVDRASKCFDLLSRI